MKDLLFGHVAGDAILATNAVLMNMFFIVSYGLDGFANATEALVGQAVGAQRLADYRAVPHASKVAAFAALASFTKFAGGSHLVGLFTHQETARLPAVGFLPWCIAVPVFSVWAFEMDGVFIGATRGKELRNSMVLSFAVFLMLALVLDQAIGNNGLWCAFASFMVVRGATPGLRLPRIEEMFAQPAPVS